MRYAVGLLLFSAYCFLQSLAFTQTVSDQPKTNKSETKHVWTNEEVQQLPGTVNVVGEPVPEKKPSSPIHGKVVSAATKEKEVCSSEQWATGVDVIVSAQAAPLGPKFWSERLFNELCLTTVNVADVAKRIEGDYVLNDGTKLKISTSLIPKDFPAPYVIVNSANEEHPFLVSWKGRALVVTHIEYNENYYDNALVSYTVKKLHLTDPLTGAISVYDSNVNVLKEIEGSLLVTVSPRQK